MDASNSRHAAKLGRQQLKRCQAGMPARQECQQGWNASKAGMPARQEFQQGRNASKSKDIMKEDVSRIS
jgi:hypothetical protein